MRAKQFVRWAIGVAAFLAVGTLLWAVLQTEAYDFPSADNVIKLDEGWTAVDQGADPSQAFAWQRALPASLPEDAALYLNINHQALAASVEGHALTVKGVYPDRIFGTSTADLFATVLIPAEYAGKTLVLSMDASGGHATPAFSDVLLTSQSTLILHLIKIAIPTLTLCGFLFVLTIILLLASILAKKHQLFVSYTAFQQLTCTSFLAGIWMLMDADIIDVLWAYHDVQYLLSFYSFMLMPLPLILFIRDIFPQYKRVLNALAITFAAAFTVDVTLMMTGVIHSLFDPLFVTHILIVIFLGIALWIGFRSKTASDYARRMIWGLLGGFSLMLVALIMFWMNDTRYALIFQLSIVCFIATLGYEIFRQSFTIVRQATESRKNLEKAERARNEVLLNQINTHFFYHIMNTARVLTQTDAKAAYQLLGDFSHYLRYKTDSSERANGKVSFRQELRSVRAYTSMQQALLGQRLNVVYDIESDDFEIPVLTLEPIVENAIKHGIERYAEGGELCITQRQTKNGVVVTVRDLGKGQKLDRGNEAEHISVGFNNVRKRLAYKHQGTLHMSVTADGSTVVTLFYAQPNQPIRDEAIR